ncbi:MAG: signal peptidase I [Bacillota bacterium]
MKAGKVALRILKYIICTVVVIALLIDVCHLYSKYIKEDPFPNCFGFSTAIVVSNSMYPTFSDGDMLIYQRTWDYQVGDVVIFSSGEDFITHRIAMETEGGYLTKGDINNSYDEFVLYDEDIYGEVIIVVSDGGRFLEKVQTAPGMFVVSCLVIAFFIMLFYKKARKKRIEPIQNKQKKHYLAQETLKKINFDNKTDEQ